MSQMTESTRRLPRIPITPEEGWLSLVLVGAMAPFRTRAVTHLDVLPTDVPTVARALAESLAEVLSPAAR